MAALVSLVLVVALSIGNEASTAGAAAKTGASVADREGDLQRAREFEGFRLYFGGQRVNGLGLRDMWLIEDGLDSTAVANYGPCTGRQGWCSHQAAIDNASICRRFPTIYYDRPNLRRFRGAMIGWVRAFRGYEIYTGKTAIGVSVKGGSKKAALKVAKRVIDVVPERRRARLPSVKRRFLNGKAKCQREYHEQLNEELGDPREEDPGLPLP